MPPNNSFFSCLNDACNKVKQYALDALSYLNSTKNARDETLQAENNTLNYKNSAETAKNEAINAKNEAQNIADNIVIPDGATYNKQEVEQMYVDMINNTNKALYMASMAIGLADNSK